MTPVLAPSSPANWRTFYKPQHCAWCGERGLFHVDTPLPVCCECVRGSLEGIDTACHPSDVRYHGDAREDSEP